MMLEGCCALLADCFSRIVLIEALTHAVGLPILENSQKE